MSLTFEQLIEICKETRRDRLKSVTKDTIADVLSKCDPREDTGYKDMKVLITTMIDEMKEMRKTNERVVTALDKIEKMEKEMDALKKNNTEIQEQLKQHAETIKHQQTFLERVDQKERACNLIILGVPEGANDDQEVEDTLTKLDPAVADEIKSVRRIGQQDPAKVRPLMVTVSKNEIRNNLVDTARGNQTLGRVKVKRDSHPAVRAEWKRLFDLVTSEEAKPGNVGRNIRVDIKKKQVLCDDLVIDSWKTNFFGKTHF